MKRPPAQDNMKKRKKRSNNTNNPPFRRSISSTSTHIPSIHTGRERPPRCGTVEATLGIVQMAEAAAAAAPLPDAHDGPPPPEADQEEAKGGEQPVPAPAPLMTCLICRDEAPAAAGVQCKAAPPAPCHFVCPSCLEGTLRCELGNLGDSVMRSQGDIRCPFWNDGCAAEPWGPEDLIGKLGPAGTLFYLQRLKEMCQHLEQREHARREEAARLEGERRGDEVGFHHNRIADLLVLKCPTCQRGFTDVDGCNRVTCKGTAADGREFGCGTNFCFVCFKVGTSNEIYSHMERDNHWFQGAELESFHRTRRIDAVAQYLRGLNEETRRRVLEACLPRTLQDVGIKAEDLQL